MNPDVMVAPEIDYLALLPMIIVGVAAGVAVVAYISALITGLQRNTLEKTLGALRQVAQERGGALWCVFGCGGDRDPGKRPQMGAIAQMADQVIVTSDNPRSEEPGAIIAQILAGMDQDHPSAKHQAIEDRAAAILWAIKHAGKQDVILLAGKGHEPYQEIKGKKMPFSDADHAALALTARLTMMRTH